MPFYLVINHLVNGYASCDNLYSNITNEPDMIYLYIYI